MTTIISEESNADAIQHEAQFGRVCPVCEQAAFTLLTPVWRNYDKPAQFRIDAVRWFAECDTCRTIVMLPLFEDLEEGGTLYYDQRETEAHVRRHFERYQRPNYDNVRAFLRQSHAPSEYRRWLDVGSVGYPTTFDDYEFTTIEPDRRAAEAGERLFGTGRIHAATIETWSDPRPYDGVLFNNSFYCLARPGHGLALVRRLLRPGGRLVITLSSCFAGAVSDRDDGRLLMLEDVIFGETLQVYYNRFSLAYLAARHGFRLLDVSDVRAYGTKTMRAHVFERVEEVTPDPVLLERSREQMAMTWADIFDGFTSSLVQTVHAVNQPDVVLAGSMMVVRDLGRYGDLSRVRGVLPVPDTHLAGTRVNGVPVLDVSALKRESPAAYRLVVCDFVDADGIATQLRAHLGDEVRISVPSRRSGMNVIDLSFRDGTYPSKGFELREVPRTIARPVLTNRRILVYGAGSGGRQAIDYLRRTGRIGQVVGVCDSDAARRGTNVEGFSVCPFDEIPRGRYDFVLIASRPGRVSIGTTLAGAGLREVRDFAGLDEVLAGDEAGAR